MIHLDMMRVKMKIVYSADDRLGAANQIADFLKSTSHEVKVAAYPKSGRLLQFVDWNLTAAKLNPDQLRHDIKEFYPDFVLIDAEPIVANIAHKLDIPILYCSSLHLLDGLVWNRGSRKYSATIEELRRKLSLLPPGVAKFIYSPFGDLQQNLEIKEDFEWIQPYHCATPSQEDGSILFLVEDPLREPGLTKAFQSSKNLRIEKGIIDNDSYQSSLSKARSLLIEGTTRQIADGIYNTKQLYLCPKIRDAENILNATVCANLQIGMDLGQVELAGLLALEKLEKAFSSPTSIPNRVKDNKRLHERINELWECM